MPRCPGGQVARRAGDVDCELVNLPFVAKYNYPQACLAVTLSKKINKWRTKKSLQPWLKMSAWDKEITFTYGALYTALFQFLKWPSNTYMLNHMKRYIIWTINKPQRFRHGTGLPTGGSRKSSDLIYSELARLDKSILASLGQQRRTAKRPPNLDDRFDAPVLMFHLWAEPKSLFVNFIFVLRSECCPNIFAELVSHPFSV